MQDQAIETPAMPALPAISPEQQHANLMPMHGGQMIASGMQEGVRGLRRTIGYVTGGGLALIVALLLLQNIAKDGMRPTDLLSSFESSLSMGIMKGNLPVGHDGKPIATQADYERELARAKSEGAAAVQFEYQKKLAAVQADQQRVVAAYTTLYQRTNMIAQAGVQMAAALQQAKQQMVASSEGGRSVVSMYGDIFCALGAQGGCEAAQNARNSMVSDMDAANVDVGARINELMKDVPDPAALVAGRDQAQNGPPALTH